MPGAHYLFEKGQNDDIGEKNIRKFMRNPLLNLTLRMTANNPYKESENERMKLWHDDENFEYWTDASTGRLIQTSRAVPETPKFNVRLSISELRIQARSIVLEEMPNIELSRLHPLEDNRNRSVYFFRFDDFSRPANEHELPPFIQVGLYANGTLASFTNTLP